MTTEQNSAASGQATESADNQYPDKYKALLPFEENAAESNYLAYISKHPTLEMSRFRGWGTYGSMFKRKWVNGLPRLKRYEFKIENDDVRWHSITVDARFEEEAKELAIDSLNERLAIRQKQPPTHGWFLRLTAAYSPPNQK